MSTVLTVTGRVTPMTSPGVGMALPVRDMRAPPRIMPILRLMLGDYFRLDRIYGIYMDEGMNCLLYTSDAADE